MTLTQEDMAKLKAPFAVAEHEFRQGHTNKAKTKMRWFVYVRREAIINRLDELFPGQWECEIIREQTFQDYATATCRTTICGLKRDGTGNGNGNADGNNEKGAATDAFKRAASMWGIGLYLQNTPMIWTDYNEQDKYNSAHEADAGRQFNRWLSSLDIAEHALPPLTRQSQQSNGNAPEQEAGPEPKKVIFVTVSERIAQNGKTYHGLKTETGEVVLAWSREPFAAAGYMERGDWAKADYLPLDPPIPATIQLDKKGGWEIVPDSIPPFDPSWAEFIADKEEPPVNDVAF